MLKTPEQILEEIKKHFEEIKNEWNGPVEKENFLEKGKFILFLRGRSDPQFPEKIKKTSILIDEALARNTIEGWRELYGKWNGDPDISQSKYNGDKDLVGGLSDLRLFLVEWEKASYQQKLHNALQTVGINPDDENIQEKAEELKKIQDDLVDLGIDKSKVKETVESERNEYKAKDEWLSEILAVNNYSEENVWEKIKTEAQIEIKE